MFSFPGSFSSLLLVLSCRWPGPYQAIFENKDHGISWSWRALCYQATSRKPLKPFESKRQSAYISVLASPSREVPIAPLATLLPVCLCKGLPKATVVPFPPSNHPYPTTASLASEAPTADTRRPRRVRQTTWTGSTARSANLASTQIADKSTASQRARPQQPRSISVGATAFVLGTLQDNPVGFNQIAAAGQRLTGHSKVSTASAISRPTSQPPGTGVG